MTDPLTLDYLRAIDASAARIAASLEALVRIADELADGREGQRQKSPAEEARTWTPAVWVERGIHEGDGCHEH